MMAHFAQHERAVGAAQRAHAEAVEHAPVRKAPVAPCQEISEIGIEITGAEAIPGEVRVAPQQNPPIPDFRFLALLHREMRIDVGAPLVGEWPRPRTDIQIERGDAMNRDWQHRPTPPTSGRPPPFSRSDRRTSCSDRSWRPSSRGRTAAAGSGRFAFPAG